VSRDQQKKKDSILTIVGFSSLKKPWTLESPTTKIKTHINVMYKKTYLTSSSTIVFAESEKISKAALGI
jgi:hypothetical protein